MATQPLPHPEYDALGGTAPLMRIVATTEAQREILLACRRDTETSLVCNKSAQLRIQGPVDFSALRCAVQALIDRHDALRAPFGKEGKEMRIADWLSTGLFIHDLSALASDERDASLRHHIRAEAVQKFDLENGPMLRLQILVLAEDDAMLVLTAHHLVCDGWSFEQVVRHFKEAVANFTHG